MSSSESGAASPHEPDAASAPVTLSDLLGALACDVTAARARADAEAVRIARIYRADPLLRTLPAPLFRLADLTISLPLAIVAVPPAGQPPPVPLALAAATVLALVLGALAEEPGESGGAAAEVARAIERERERLEREPEVAREATRVADALLDAALGALTAIQRTLAEAADRSHGGSFEQELRATARARVLALTPTPGVQIAATTAAIEAVSARDSLAQLRVNLTERGVEWTIDEHQRERLVPE